MFSDQEELSIASIGEAALLKRLAVWLGDAMPEAPCGMGDDSALVSSYARQTLLTTDGVIYKRHFDDSATPQQAGEKLAKRNVSDIAAMGGKPMHALVSIMAGPDLCLDWLEQFHYGMKHCAEKFAFKIVGGDLSQSEKGQFAAHMALLGEASERPLLRTGAQAGDALFVTGELGSTRAAHHLSFEPRLSEGQWLAAQSSVHAMMDLSDGLLKDLPALLPDAACAQLCREDLPLRSTCVDRSISTQLKQSLDEGEDYELLFAVDAAQAASLQSQWQQRFQTKLSCIGKIQACGVEQSGRIYAQKATDADGTWSEEWSGGYAHFSKPHA